VITASLESSDVYHKDVRWVGTNIESKCLVIESVSAAEELSIFYDETVLVGKGAWIRPRG
jgi:hypothetical protein